MRYISWAQCLNIESSDFWEAEHKETNKYNPILYDQILTNRVDFQMLTS